MKAPHICPETPNLVAFAARQKRARGKEETLNPKPSRIFEILWVLYKGIATPTAEIQMANNMEIQNPEP